MLKMLMYSLMSLVFSEFESILPDFKIQKFNIERNGSDIDITIVKINPDKYKMEIYHNDDKDLTIKDIAIREGYVLLFNSGMFDIDYKSSMGFLKSKGNILNSKNHPQYLSVIAFDPIRKGYPNFYMYDLESISIDSINSIYDSVIQNLRLIKRPRENRWPKQSKEWMELAIGQDTSNNFLLIYCHSYISMHELNEVLLDLPIDLQVAQHLEGNLVAQFYLSTDSMQVDYDYGHYVPNLIGFKIK